LAEVLITLGIIGVVAAMTILTLMNKTQDLEFKTAYKKTYSVASQAWLSAIGDGLIQQRSAWCDANGVNDANFTAFKSYFKVAKDCEGGSASDLGCWAADGDSFWGVPTGGTGAYSFLDSSGVSWAGAGGICGTIVVDTNGLKKPNQFGKDRQALAMDSGNSDSFKILPWEDVIAVDVNTCPKGNCYYTTWLLGK